MSKGDTNISLSQNKSRIYQSASPPFFLQHLMSPLCGAIRQKILNIINTNTHNILNNFSKIIFINIYPYFMY